MLDSWSVHLTLYRMTPCWTRDLCIWHCTEWRHVGLVICASDIVQNDAMLDLWSVYLTLYKMMPCWTRDLCIWHLQNDAMLDSWSVYLTFTEWCHVGLVICVSDIYRMMPCWTHDLCIWHYTEWLHVGLVICIWHYTWWRNVGLVTYVSDIIQNDVGLVICVSDIIHDDAMLDSWSVYLTLYMMTQCWTRDLCIWHYTWWCNVGLVTYVSDIIQNDVGLVICVSDIIQNGSMLDFWSVYLTLYRMASCWPCDRVSDIIQNDAMLD